MKHHPNRSCDSSLQCCRSSIQVRPGKQEREVQSYYWSGYRCRRNLHPHPKSHLRSSLEDYSHQGSRDLLRSWLGSLEGLRLPKGLSHPRAGLRLPLRLRQLSTIHCGTSRRGASRFPTVNVTGFRFQNLHQSWLRYLFGLSSGATVGLKGCWSGGGRTVGKQPW